MDGEEDNKKLYIFSILLLLTLGSTTTLSLLYVFECLEIVIRFL